MAKIDFYRFEQNENWHIFRIRISYKFYLYPYKILNIFGFNNFIIYIIKCVNFEKKWDIGQQISAGHGKPNILCFFTMSRLTAMKCCWLFSTFWQHSGYIEPNARPAPLAAAKTPAAIQAVCVAYVTDTDVFCIKEPVSLQPHLMVAQLSPLLWRSAGWSTIWLYTLSQWIAHWRKFHMAIAPVITCMVSWWSAKFTTGPDTVDAFLCHLVSRHVDLSNGGRWPRLNSLIRAGMDIVPNTCYWSPSSDNGPHLRPSHVEHLTSEEILCSLMGG